MRTALLAELDDLVLTVRDRNSRSYILEAINANRAEAYRAAIISTWIAVTYDLISKIRELATQGDAEAKKVVETLDKDIDAQERGDMSAVVRFQKFENELLDKALTKFEFISRQEHVDLSRLKDDRNLCAHPAFAKEGTLFQPLPELVRTHIVHAVDHLLQHPPTQGKNALVRLLQDLTQPSFPSDSVSVYSFMQHRYFDHIKQGLLKNVVTVLLKTIVLDNEPRLRGHERNVINCLAAVQQYSKTVYEDTMAETLPKLTADLTDDNLQRVIQLFSIEPRIWEWLGEDLKLRIKQVVKVYSFELGTADFVFSGLDVDELRPLLIRKLEQMKPENQIELFRRYPRAEFVDSALDLFKAAGGWRYAEQLATSVIVPLSEHFSAVDIKRLLEVIAKNDQICEASGMPEPITEVFHKAEHLHPQTQVYWQEFIAARRKTRFPFNALYRAIKDADMLSDDV